MANREGICPIVKSLSEALSCGTYFAEFLTRGLETTHLPSGSVGLPTIARNHCAAVHAEQVESGAWLCATYSAVFWATRSSSWRFGLISSLASTRRVFRHLFGYIRGIQVNIALAQTE